MNQLFYYRLAIISGQLMLLMINLIWTIWPSTSWPLWLGLIGYLSVVIWIRWTNRQKAQISKLLLLADLLMWGLIFHTLGGVSNPLIWCLLIPVVFSALSQSIVYTWVVTMAANLIYAWLWLVPTTQHDAHVHHVEMQQHITGMWLGFMAVSALLTWAMTTLMLRLNTQNAAIRQLEQQQQNDANLIKMATLATSLAHELGTPLNSIKLLIDDMQFGADSEQQQDLDMLDSQVLRCKQVLSELTAVTEQSQVETGKPQPAIEFVQHTLKTMADSVELQTQVTNQADNHLIMVDSLLQLAFMNVLNNSVSAGAQCINIGLSKRAEWVVIVINDDGRGSAQPASNGLGIGLVLTRRVIESLGGQMSFARSSSGAECSIELPCIKDPADD